MAASMGVSALEAPAKGCFACAPLSPGPDRDQCPCRAPVGLACIGAILEPPPVEPEARLEHLRRQAQLAAGAREHAEREAVFQDRWDAGHARDLRTTSSSYAHTEQRLRREIERAERELAVAHTKPPTKGKKKAASRPTRRGNTRRAPGRSPRPAGRRATQSRPADGGGGGDGDPPSGDPDPAPAPGAAASIAQPLPPFKAPGLPGGAARARAIELTIEFWSKRLGHRISEEEARQILERMVALDALLTRWQGRRGGRPGGSAP